MRKRPSQPKLAPIGEILGPVLAKRNIPHTVLDRRLVDLWRSCVGPSIAAQTHPEGIRRGLLYVRVSAPIWMHQLQFLKEEILDKLHRTAPAEEIRGLFFSIGPLPRPAVHPGSAPSSSPPGPLSGRDRLMVQESLATVADPELREILGRVMTVEIGRRRTLQKRQAP